MNFDKPYNRTIFLNLLQSKIFPTFVRKEERLSFWNKTAYFVENWIYRLWTVNLDKEISVLEIEQKSSNDPRITLTKDAFKILEHHWIDHAIIVFHCKDTNSYRLSLLTVIYENWEKKTSSYKRFSYILWPNEKLRTVNQQLIKRWQIKNYEDLVSRFDVEVVRKEFFETYLELFVRLYKEILKDKSFSDLLTSQNVDLVSFTKNLLWKIIFLYFVQQKWWLWLWRNTTTKYWEWDKDFMRKLWKNFKEQWESLCTHEKTWYFYNDYLEWLFYAWLNVDRRDNDDWFEQLQMKVPYLNGWLFKEEYIWWQNNIAKVNNDIFSNVDEKWDDADWILDIFDRYNFTIDEDSLYDTDIAVDPEMLGRIFEKMISISSENIKDVLEIYDKKKTNTKFDFWKDLNKKLWAFYTPREIVHYMTKESLIAYLWSKTSLSEDNIRILFELKEKFLLNSADMKKAEYSTETLMEIWNSVVDVDNALKEVKILDPAVWSWAFPMGLLHEISSLRHYMYIVFDKIFRERLENYKDKDENISLYLIKKDIILNNIYWVDIDPGAIDIAKLRFWLSLVVDEQEPEPLPNFEFKFISADSLIPLKEWSLFTKSDVIEKLRNLRDEYYKCDNKDEKDNLKRKFYDIKRELTWFWKTRLDFQSKKERNEYLLQSYSANSDQRNRQILEWDPFETKEYTKRSDTELMMWQDKFDIVIWNPPYIKIQNLDEKQVIEYKNLFRTAVWKFDLYVLFVEKSFSFLNSNWIISFIHPHRFLNTWYWEWLRKFLLSNKWLNKYLGFWENQVFDNATTYSWIFFYRENSETIYYCEIDKKSFDNLEFVWTRWKDLWDKWIFHGWINNPILDKINWCNTKLLDVFEWIYQWLITLWDDLFMLEWEIKWDLFYGYSKEISKNVVLEAEMMKPVLKWENIRRYMPCKNNLFVIYLHKQDINGKTVPIDEDEFKNKYPKIYDYLFPFKEYLVEKKKKYKTNPQFRYSLHRARDINIFISDKILTPQLQNNSNFTIDNESYYPDAWGYMLNLKNNIDHDMIYYYLWLFNSKLFYYFIKCTSTVFNNEYYYFKSAYIEPFKLPDSNQESQKKIISIVKDILDKKKENVWVDTSSIESLIDQIVYKLYRLTDDEIQIVEDSIK